MTKRWTEEQANSWYAKLPWLRGCNFIGSDCANRFDMWQSHNAEEHLKTAERELALCEKIGFNTVRIWLIFEAYHSEPEHFMEMVEKYLAICHRHGIRVMFVLAHEEFLPRGEIYHPTTVVGEQTYSMGYHQGIPPLSGEEKAKTPHHYFDYPELQEPFLQMIRSVVGKYANDERILCWNVLNEPGITLPQERSCELLRIFFSEVRKQNPSQPLCADIWRTPKMGELQSESEKLALELSDIISFHNYGAPEKFARFMHHLKSYNRPIVCTEWLHRVNHNHVKDIYPMLFLDNVANYCWGFVVGKTQTNEPWESLWQQYEADNSVDYDFTQWQHDLFRPNHRPYDPKEVRIIMELNTEADRIWNEKHSI